MLYTAGNSNNLQQNYYIKKKKYFENGFVKLKVISW